MWHKSLQGNATSHYSVLMGVFAGSQNIKKKLWIKHNNIVIIFAIDTLKICYEIK